MTATPVTLAAGDGIGPEIMNAVLQVLEAAGADLNPEWVDMGAKAYSRTCPDGVSAAAWESLQRTRVLLKGPVEVQEGRGMIPTGRALEMRLGLFARIQPCRSWHPLVPHRVPGMNVTVIRELEEDLYGDLEYRQTVDVTQGLKLIHLPGIRRMLRYAFEHARIYQYRKVTVLTKDKVMEFTDGAFDNLLQETGAAYPEIFWEHQSLDVGSALLTDHPENFEVIVIPSLYGDILSHLVNRVSHSKPGLTVSGALGDGYQLFESGPDTAAAIAGQNLANPSGLLLAATMLLVHIQQSRVAERIQNAWLATLEAGLHTADIFHLERSRQLLGTREFAQAVIERLDQEPEQTAPVRYRPSQKAGFFALRPLAVEPDPEQSLVGVDIFFDRDPLPPEKFARQLQELCQGSPLQLELISNLGVLVWPENIPETRISDHWHCRFMHQEPGRTVDYQAILDLLACLSAAGLDFIKCENLYNFAGQPAFSA